MIRTRAIIVAVPGYRGPLLSRAVEVLWEKDDDPMPFLRLLAHFDAIDGAATWIPVVDHGHVGALS